MAYIRKGQSIFVKNILEEIMREIYNREMTQAEFAKKSCIRRETLNKYFSGYISPSWTALNNMVAALGMKLEIHLVKK